MVGMERDAQGQSGFLGCGSPLSQDVTLRTDILRVPGLVLGIPQVVVVVMVAQYEEILGTATLVTLDKFLRFPLLGLEERQDILIAELRGMTVMFAVVLILVVALHIHLAGHPVTTAFHALGTPMRPDAELGITEPFGRLMGLKRRPCRLVLSRLHVLMLFGYGHFAILCTGHRQTQRQGG